jgi:hypothetical protein
MSDDPMYDKEAFNRGEWQVYPNVNSLGLNHAGIAMVHRNNPNVTRINRFGSLCLKEEFYYFLLLGIGYFATKSKGKKPVIDPDYV